MSTFPSFRILATLLSVAVTVAIQPTALAQSSGPLPRGARILSLDSTPTEANDDGVANAQAFFGVQGTQLMVNWTDIETAPGVYDSALLDLIDAYYSSNGITVSLTIRPIDAIHRHLPADLATLGFDDARTIYRFALLLDHVFARLEHVSLASVGIGNEVDEYFRIHPEELPAYKAFYDASLYHAKVLRTDVKIGVSANLHALTTSGNAPFLQALNEFSDVILVLYYPLNFDFTVRGPNVVAADVAALASRYWYKPIHFREAGYPSGPETGGSEEQQRAFIAEMFRVWDLHSQQIELVSFFRFTDFAPDQIDFYSGYYQQTGSAPFRSFLSSLGLREWSGYGRWKPAFIQFYIEARSRGW